jgi:hypothetical protein
MVHKGTAYALAAVGTLVVIVLLVFVLSPGPSGVAFAQVLEKLHGSAYTCELLAGPGGEAPPVVQMSVLSPGRMRLDSPTGIGEISVIVDVSRSESMILFHRQRAAVWGPPDPEEEPEAWGLLNFCLQPIEQLWGLRDGSEEELGEQEIEGQPAEGFRVRHEGGDVEHEITIWAHAETGMPVLVEIVFTLIDDPDATTTVAMRRFALQDDLDEDLFRLEVPEGYTLAYRKNREDLDDETDRSDEAERITEVLSLWEQGEAEAAIEVLLSIDWAQPIEFAGEPYLFSLTESAYISLKADEQREIMAETMVTGGHVRKIARELVARAERLMSAREYKAAEAHLKAGVSLGYLLSRDAEALVIGRLLGIAVQQLTLEKLIELYEATRDEKARQEAEAMLKAARDEAAQIKKDATGR